MKPVMRATRQMPKLSVFSGLGTDERAFRFIDFSEFDVTFINWIALERDEPLDHYARRLARQIETSFPILLGLPFEGIVAAEVAGFIETPAKTAVETPGAIFPAKASRDTGPK
jgi:hypothetical protein